MLTVAALAAAVLGLSGSLLLSFRERALSLLTPGWISTSGARRTHLPSGQVDLQ
jgi:hypothetical protein